MCSVNKRVAKTACSGLGAVVVDAAAMIALIELANVPVGIAAFLAACCGAVANFIISKFWAFADRSRVSARQLGSFAIVVLVNAAFVATCVHFLANLFGVQYLVSKWLASALGFVVWSYPAQAKLVFPAARRRAYSTTLVD